MPPAFEEVHMVEDLASENRMNDDMPDDQARYSVLTEEQQAPAREIYDARAPEDGGYQPPAVYPVGSGEALAGSGSDPERAEPPYHEAFIGDGIANRGFLNCDAEAPSGLA